MSLSVHSLVTPELSPASSPHSAPPQLQLQSGSVARPRSHSQTLPCSPRSQTANPPPLHFSGRRSHRVHPAVNARQSTHEDAAPSHVRSGSEPRSGKGETLQQARSASLPVDSSSALPSGPRHSSSQDRRSPSKEAQSSSIPSPSASARTSPSHPTSLPHMSSSFTSSTRTQAQPPHASRLCSLPGSLANSFMDSSESLCQPCSTSFSFSEAFSSTPLPPHGASPLQPPSAKPSQQPSFLQQKASQTKPAHKQPPPASRARPIQGAPASFDGVPSSSIQPPQNSSTPHPSILTPHRSSCHHPSGTDAPQPFSNDLCSDLVRKTSMSAWEHSGSSESVTALAPGSGLMCMNKQGSLPDESVSILDLIDTNPSDMAVQGNSSRMATMASSSRLAEPSNSRQLAHAAARPAPHPQASLLTNALPDPSSAPSSPDSRRSFHQLPPTDLAAPTSGNLLSAPSSANSAYSTAGSAVLTPGSVEGPETPHLDLKRFSFRASQSAPSKHAPPGGEGSGAPQTSATATAAQERAAVRSLSCPINRSSSSVHIRSPSDSAALNPNIKWRTNASHELTCSPPTSTTGDPPAGPPAVPSAAPSASALPRPSLFSVAVPQLSERQTDATGPAQKPSLLPRSPPRWEKNPMCTGEEGDCVPELPVFPCGNTIANPLTFSGRERALERTPGLAAAIREVFAVLQEESGGGGVGASGAACRAAGLRSESANTVSIDLGAGGESILGVSAAVGAREQRLQVACGKLLDSLSRADMPPKVTHALNAPGSVVQTLRSWLQDPSEVTGDIASAVESSMDIVGVSGEVDDTLAIRAARELQINLHAALAEDDWGAVQSVCSHHATDVATPLQLPPGGQRGSGAGAQVSTAGGTAGGASVGGGTGAAVAAQDVNAVSAPRYEGLQEEEEEEDEMGVQQGCGVFLFSWVKWNWGVEERPESVRSGKSASSEGGWWSWKRFKEAFAAGGGKPTGSMRRSAGYAAGSVASKEERVAVQATIPD